MHWSPVNGIEIPIPKNAFFRRHACFFQEITIIFEDFCANYIFTSLQGTTSPFLLDSLGVNETFEGK